MTQESVRHAVRVNETSRNLAFEVDAFWQRALARPGACTVNIEFSDAAVWSAQETVKRSAGVGVESRDNTQRVHAGSISAWARTEARTWSVNIRDCAARSAKVTPKSIGRVYVSSRECAFHVKGNPAGTPGALSGFRTRARNIED